MTPHLLEFEDVTIRYQTDHEPVTAVSDVSFTIDVGENFGLAGESGCGKSTIAKAILGGLDENGKVTSGKIKYKGEEIQSLSQKELSKKIRWSEISIIPQSSMNSLDPLERISDIALEIAKTHTDLTREAAKDRFQEAFRKVGLPTNRINDYPHQFSGGMQQRVVIALSMFLNPSLIIADEPTTALDVIMQDRVFQYIDQLTADDVSMMLITHDIALIFESCSTAGIMHSGQLAETGTVEALYDNPRHPYSILLQESFPDVRYPNRELEIIPGVPPQQHGEIDYCTFVDRCPWAIDECAESVPELSDVENPEGEPTVIASQTHRAACFRMDEVRELYQQEGRPPELELEGENV